MEWIINGTEKALHARAKLRAQANPIPVQPTAKQYIVSENTSVGAGKDKQEIERALTLAEKLRKDDAISFEEWQAASELRELHFRLMPPSEGVSSYGGATGRADPARKADRKAKRLTGIEVREDASVARGPSRSNRSDQWAYRDALFAMAGCHDDEGTKVIDPHITRIMLRVVADNERMPTQLEIGQARAAYSSKKQLSAVGANFIKEHLHRLAMHFRMVKGETVR